MGLETAKRVSRRPKSYRGCKACKSARKKCSEAKPECAFCIRNGLKCEYDINFVLRFETFVNGKQPRRRSSNKSKDSDCGRQSSRDSTVSEDNSTLPNTPAICTPDISDHAVDSDLELQVICMGESPESLQESDAPLPDMKLCYRYPQLFVGLDSEDTHYVDYFRSEVNVVLPYFQIFPCMVTDILSRAATDEGLFHTVLSISHLIADSRLHRSLVPAFQHQTQALSLLQQSISSANITEAVAISVAMLVWLNITRGNRAALNQHLQGLYLIFQEIHAKYQYTSPLLNQLWRFSIRMEIVATTLFFPRLPLFLSEHANRDNLHRNWILPSVKDAIGAEWTLASFALDNLMHRACCVAMLAYELRHNPPGCENMEIQKSIQALLIEHAEWKTRSIIRQAEIYEQRANIAPLKKSDFLDYPPLQVYNKFYANLLNSWRAIYIFIDLIAYPEIGPGRGGKQSKRYLLAVDICRTYAALGKDDMFPIGKVMTVFLTGVALGGRRTSPKEVNWIYDFMVVGLKEYFPLSQAAAAAYENFWELEGNYWDLMARLTSGLSLDSML